jgi:uncharacterized protein YwqG
VFTSEDQIAVALVAADVEEQYAQRIAKEARPCIWLKTKSVADEAEIALGATKIGGRPDLPGGQDWPVRPAYPAGERASRYRDGLEDPKKHWSWASPEQHKEFSRDYAQMIEVIEKPFPLTFIAQINLAEAGRAGPLDPDFPKCGLLSIFYDTLEGPWGFDPADHIGSMVLFHATDAARLTRREPPTELVAIERYAPFAPLICHAQACLTPLPIETAHIQNLNFDEKTVDTIHEWWSKDDNMYGSEGGVDWKCHRVGGWPTPIQGDMQTECALVAAGYYCGNGDAYRAAETEAVRATANEWLLLAQIGTDEGAQMMWGDNGQLYVRIRREDLVARRFEAARLILQCY